MQVLATDETNDLVLNNNNRLKMLTGANAVGAATEHTVSTLLGEMIYQSTDGVPYQEVVFNGVPDLVQIQFYIVREIHRVTGVVRVSDFTINFLDNILSYEARLETIYGEIFINGQV